MEEMDLSFCHKCFQIIQDNPRQSSLPWWSSHNTRSGWRGYHRG